MQCYPKQKTIQSVIYDLNNGKFNLNHKFQRPEGQWNKKKQTKLIDSFLRGFPTNHIFVTKEDVLGVIEGVQRLSSLRDIINNKIRMSDINYPLFIDGEEVILAKKKFKDLDKKYQDKILNTELTFYEIVDYDERELQELFDRLNSGKPLTSSFMRVVYEDDKTIETINKFTNHPFMKKMITPAQHKSGVDRNVILQTLMLICSTEENSYTSFTKEAMNNFAENIASDNLDKLDNLELALDKLDAAYEKKVKIPRTSMPFVLYGADKTLRKGKSFDNFLITLNGFLNTYDKNEEYKALTKNGTTNASNVKARYDYWNKIVK